MEHIPTISTGEPFAPVMLMPDTGLIIRAWVSAH